MEKELALRTFGYLIEYYKTHEETTINSQEIEAINYILDENKRLETQLKKQKEIIDRLKELNLTISDSDYVYSQDEITNKNLELLQMLEDKEV